MAKKINVNKEAVVEAAKELFRVLLFAAIGWGIAYASGLPESQTTGIVLVVLRTVDKFLHNSTVDIKGISPI